MSELDYTEAIYDHIRESGEPGDIVLTAEIAVLAQSVERCRSSVDFGSESFQYGDAGQVRSNDGPSRLLKR